jgi:hypothetical protein
MYIASSPISAVNYTAAGRGVMPDSTWKMSDNR